VGFPATAQRGIVMQHVKSLDGLRGMAVLLVMLCHASWVGCGWIGVQIFFVLSGYLITGILLEDKEKAQSLGLYLKRFYWRRTLRIFPPYYAYLALLAVFFMVSGQPAAFKNQWPYLFTYTYNLTPFFPHFTYTPFYTHFWSLAVEEQFYLVWPLLVYLLSRQSLRRLIIVLLIVGPLSRLVAGFIGRGLGMTPFDAATAANCFSVCQGDAFAAGAAVALGVGRRWLARFPNLPVLVLTAAAVLGAANLTALRLAGVPVSMTTLGYPPSSMGYFQHVWGYTMINLTAAAGVLHLVSREGQSGFWSSPRLVNIGKVSYGIYIFHWPILFLVKHIVWFQPNTFKAFLVLPVYMIVVILLANLSYRYYESRFLSLKDRKFALIPGRRALAGEIQSAHIPVLKRRPELPEPRMAMDDFGHPVPSSLTVTPAVGRTEKRP
jgi:peptidoglycan/LPS O-acetylase OafA/YrhL